MSNTPNRAVSRVSPCALNVKAWELSNCVLPDIFRPFTFDSTKQLRKEEEEEYRGDGARG